MAKKILIISTSLRDKSNSEMLADAFMDGANASEDDAGGVNEAGEIKEHPALKKAYEMGKNIK